MIFKFGDDGNKKDAREFKGTRPDGGNPIPTERREQVRVGPGGELHVPGMEEQQTVGLDPVQLEAKKREHERRKFDLERRMRSVYQCTQCKRKWWGRYVRVGLVKTAGVEVEILKCADPRCDAPVVLRKDALDLRQPPGGERSAV